MHIRQADHLDRAVTARAAPGAGGAVTLAVISRVRLYREGLVLLLGSTGGIRVVGSAGNERQALDLVVAARPAIALMDVALVKGPTLMQAVTRALPSIRVLAFGVPDDPSEIISCAEAGVCGYVSSEADAAELVEVVMAMSRDEVSCTPFVARTLLQRVGELSGSLVVEAGVAQRRGTSLLTSREAEIMALVEQGLMNKQIARRLSISVSTVKNHVHRILQKEDVSRRSELTRRPGSRTS